MIKVRKSTIEAAIPNRPAGYWEDIKQSAASEDETHFRFDKETLDRLKVKYSDSDHRNISFVYPFWQGGANYDELRWSIRSIYQSFQPLHSQTFNVVIVGDQPLIRRMKDTWYKGQIIPCPRISKGRTFRPKLNDALHKWRTALNSELVSDTIVWMMDDIYFLKPFTLEELAKPRAFKHKTEASLDRWKERSGFSSAKKRSIELLHEAELPMWDFATHLPHVVDRHKVLEVFEKFKVQENEVLWEVLYENYVLGDQKPGRAGPFLAYFTDPQNASRIEHLAQKCNVMVNGGGSWNEDLRRFLYRHFPDPSPLECQEAPAPKPDPQTSQSFLMKVARCEHRGAIAEIVTSQMCGRKGIELPVFQCNRFGKQCTIDQFKSAQKELVCKVCILDQEEGVEAA